MKITSKYILREHLGPLTFSLGALTSLLLLNYIARKFGDLVGKGLPWKAIAQFFFLSVPFTIAMTLPMAVLVSVLYAFSRLASENEVTAFKASGVAMGRLLGPVLWAATALAVAMVLFNDQVLPRANHTLSQLQQDIARTSPTFLLKERVLNEIGDTGYQLQANHVDQIRHTMREVTIYDMSQTSPRTIRADSGAIGLMKNGRDLQVTLYDGEIEQLADGKPDRLHRIFYATQLMRVRDVVKSFDPTKPNASDYKSDREMSICELQDAYIRSRTEYLRAQLDYDIAVADSLKKPRPKASPKRRVFLGIGRLYCQALHDIEGLSVVRQAKAQPPAAQPPAAQPPAAQPPATQPPTTQPAATQPAAAKQPPAAPRPDTTRRPTADSARRPTSDSGRPAAPAATTPAPVTPPATTPAATTPVGAATAQPPVPPSATPGMVPPPVPPPAAMLPPGATPSVTPSVPPPGTIATPPNAVPSTPRTTPGAADASAAGSVAFGTSVVALSRVRVGEALGTMNGYDVEIHKKFALAVACIVFVLLGAPIALRFPRGGVGLVIGVSLFVFALYYSFLIAGEELSNRGLLPPWIAMWAANVLFAAAGIPLALRMGSGSGSARGGGFGEWLDDLRYRLRRRRGAAS